MTLHEIHTRMWHAYHCGRGIRLSAEQLRKFIECDTAMKEIMNELDAEEDARRYEEDGEARAHLPGSWA